MGVRFLSFDGEGLRWERPSSPYDGGGLRWGCASSPWMGEDKGGGEMGFCPKISRFATTTHNIIMGPPLNVI